MRRDKPAVQDGGSIRRAAEGQLDIAAACMTVPREKTGRQGLIAHLDEVCAVFN